MRKGRRSSVPGVSNSQPGHRHTVQRRRSGSSLASQEGKGIEKNRGRQSRGGTRRGQGFLDGRGRIGGSQLCISHAGFSAGVYVGIARATIKELAMGERDDYIRKWIGSSVRPAPSLPRAYRPLSLSLPLQPFHAYDAHDPRPRPTPPLAAIHNINHVPLPSGSSATLVSAASLPRKLIPSVRSSR